MDANEGSYSPAVGRNHDVSYRMVLLALRKELCNRHSHVVSLSGAHGR